MQRNRHADAKILCNRLRTGNRPECAAFPFSRALAVHRRNPRAYQEQRAQIADGEHAFLQNNCAQQRAEYRDQEHIDGHFPDRMVFEQHGPNRERGRAQKRQIAEQHEAAGRHGNAPRAAAGQPQRQQQRSWTLDIIDVESVGKYSYMNIIYFSIMNESILSLLMK